MSVLTLKRPLQDESGLFLSGILAVLVHVVFVVFMVFSLDWKSHPPESMVVELWHDLSEPIEPAPVQKAEPPKPEPIPEPPAPEPPKPVETEPLPPEIEVSPPPSPSRKPDIVRQQEKPVIDDKKEQEREREKEKVKEREKAKAEQLRREEAQRQREREAKEKRDAQEAAVRAQQMSEVAKYKAMILAKVKSRIIMPPDLPGNPNVEYLVTLLPGGDILDVKLSKSSGFAVYDDAVERAIFLSKPLPLPPNPALFSQFRNLSITVHYHE